MNFRKPQRKAGNGGTLVVVGGQEGSPSRQGYQRDVHLQYEEPFRTRISTTLTKDIEVLDEAGQARRLAPLIFLMDRVLISQQLARLLHEPEYLVGKVLRAVLVRPLLFKKLLH